MRRKPDICPGTKLNRLTILSPAADVVNDKGYRTRMVFVRCDCGVEKTIRAAAFFSEHLKSCGCLKLEKFTARATKHGHCKGRTRSKAHRAWNDAIERCSRPSHPSYTHYGARGIVVCERWQAFENFIADMGEPGPRMTLDRIDNSRGYEPGNCRWTTWKQQARNKRTSRFIEHDGQRRTLAEWAEMAGLLPSTLRRRIESGMPLAQAMAP